MNNDLFKAGVSRRGFLTGSAALCAMAGLGLTGCGGSGAESGSAAASGQDVEYRDELQIALPASPDGLDPHHVVACDHGHHLQRRRAALWPR